MERLVDATRLHQPSLPRLQRRQRPLQLLGGWPHEWPGHGGQIVGHTHANAAHGIGEPANVATAAALANAVYNAIGVRIRDLPMTPRTVLAALNKGGRS